jgi:hypothetical protein
MAFGFGAGIGFFLALALCFGVYKMAMGVANGIARSRRTRRSRSLAKSMETSFRRHAWDPLNSYEWALGNVSNLEQYLSTLPPNEEASETAAELLAEAKAVQAVCERALRIERIANLLDGIAKAEKFQSALASNADYLTRLDANFVAAQRTPAAQANTAKRIAEDKAAVVAAKEGPLTWWKPDDGYRDANGKVHHLGPRGFGLSPVLIAEAEAELDGYRSFAPGEVENRPKTMAENGLLIAVAANRKFERAVHQPSWMR